MVLAHECRTGKVAQIERFDTLARHARVRETFLTSLDRQRAQIQVGEGAKRSLARGDHCHRSHIFSLADLALEHRRNRKPAHLADQVFAADTQVFEIAQHRQPDLLGVEEGLSDALHIAGRD
jgi:hypothetical protein